MKTRRGLAAASGGVLAGALLLGGCGDEAELDRRSIAAATVEGKTGFSPGSIKVEKDHSVVLVVDNKTDRLHGLSIEGQDESREVQPNRPLVVEFTPKEAGTFRIFCQLHDTHQAAELIVE